MLVAAFLQDDLFSTRQIAKRGLPKHVDLLKFKSLSEEMKLLGIVKEVSAKELLVSLPHGLRGHVSIPEASDLLAERIQANAKAGVAPTTGLPSLTVRPIPLMQRAQNLITP